MAMAQGKNAYEVILKADETTLVVKAEKDGKLRFRCNAWGMTPRWF